MTEETQNLAWRCLSKKARELCRNMNRTSGDGNVEFLLDELFGNHNLTSDEEPDEMLMIPRKGVIERYSTISKEIDDAKSERYINFCEGRINILTNLFGDKCLPDKEGVDLNELDKKLDEALKKETSESLNEWIDKESSVQGESSFKVGDKALVIDGFAKGSVITIMAVNDALPISYKSDIRDNGIAQWFLENVLEPYIEPKFNVGDKFRFKKNRSKVRTVKSILKNGRICFFEKDVDGLSRKFLVSPEYIEPYTEPKYKVGDEVVVIYGNHKGFNGIIKEYSEDDGTWAVILNGYNYPIHFAEEWIEPYTEPETEDNMEEKELNLVELLKGCEGEELYSPSYGKCVLKTINKDNNNGSQPLISVTLEDGTSRNFSANGKICWGVDKFAPISLFPYALYEKYPLDARKAWDEWAEERKPKRWRAKENQSYWRIKGNGEIVCEPEMDAFFDDQHYGCMNYFRTEKEAQQAAEAVRECLAKFHESISQSK